MIHREPLEAVVRRASAIVVVEVQRVYGPREEGCWRSVEYSALPVEVLFGASPGERAGAGAAPISCLYSEGMPHQRGGVSVSPLVTGSGLELQVKEGDRVVFILEAWTDSREPLTLLRVEPLVGSGGGPAISSHAAWIPSRR